MKQNVEHYEYERYELLNTFVPAWNGTVIEALCVFVSVWECIENMLSRRDVLVFLNAFKLKNLLILIKFMTLTLIHTMIHTIQFNSSDFNSGRPFHSDLIKSASVQRFRDSV